MDINSQKGYGRVRSRQQAAMDGFVQARVRMSKNDSFKLSKTTAKKKVVKEAVPVVIVSEALVREPTPLSKYVPAQHPKQVVRPRHRVRRLVVRGFAVLFIAILSTGGFLSYKGYTKLHKVFRGTTTVAALSSKAVDPNLLEGEGDGRVNILLLGVGGAGHDGPDLTDTLLILSVDPVNNTAALLSIPRDLWVKMPVNYFGSYQKINAAYESGKYQFLGKLDPSDANAQAVQAGFDSIDTVISQVAGITINYHVLVNFQAFRQAIDTVGGITVNVPDELYDPTMEWENNYNPILAAAGVQTMDGKKALLYARSRETTSDFARTERQRQIMLALKDKVLTAGTLSNPAKIEGLINAFGDNVYSDMSTQGAERLYGIMKKINNSSINSIGLAQPPNNFVTTDHVGNISVVRPQAGFDNYTAIQDYVHTQLPDGYILKEHASIALVAPTLAAGTALAAELKTYDYDVTSTVIANTASSHTVLVDLSGGSDKYTLNYLQKRFDVTAVTKLPASVTIKPGSAKFVIITSK